MHLIAARDLVVEFPIFGAKSRSLKNTFIRAATGGSLEKDSSDRVVVRALDHLDFEFRDGDRIGLVGHNGSGKSTLLRVLAGAYEPVGGTIDVRGTVASMLSITLGMDMEATGYENILLRGAIMGLKPEQTAAIVDDVCEFSELGDFIDMPMRTYSSGMSMRLAFAIATSMQADIILMDEWLSAGDAGFSAKAQQRMNDLLDQAKILVLASHSPDVIRRNCSRILLLEHGRIVSETRGGFGQARRRGTVDADGKAAAADEPARSAEADWSIPLEERIRVWSTRGVPSYDASYLVTWLQSIDFMRDDRFLSAYERGMDSGHHMGRPPGSKEDAQVQWQVAICCWAARHASRLPGDFVECGTNTGILSLAICDYLDFNTLDKSFWLFDTYEGIPPEQVSPEERAQGRIEQGAASYSPCYDLAKRNFAPYPRARLIKGKVPESLSTAPIDKVAYLCLDMTIAYPERAAIEYFWPRMVTGAIAVLNLYGWAPYRPQKRVLDEFANKEGVEIMLLPTGQGLLIKP